MPSYRQYRKYGHGRFVAFSLSIHPMAFYGFTAGLGVLAALVWMATA